MNPLQLEASTVFSFGCALGLLFPSFALSRSIAGVAAFRSALTQYDDFYAMLSDRVRMGAYDKAIRTTVRPGDVVVDLGSGTGILGFLALRAGASKVYAIEKSDSIELARAVAERNGLTERIVFLSQSSRDVSLPERADVLVSETLGSFGIDENTLDFTIDARERFIKPGGRLLPHRIRVFLAPAEAPQCFKKVEFWREIQGIDFSPAHELFTKKLMVESVAEEQLLSAPGCFVDRDLTDAHSAICQNTLLLKIQRPGTIHGFAGWFELFLTDHVILSTAPTAPRTHWKQAFFPITESIRVIAGDVLELSMVVKPHPQESDGTMISYQYRCSQLGKESHSGRVKIGRNDPCLCGSGLKYKKCCG